MASVTNVTSPAVQLATSLVDDNIGGPGVSTSSWKPTGDPFGMGNSSVGSVNSASYQQSEYQSPSLFHHQGSPVPANTYGNNTPQQQHYSPLTPGGGTLTPVPVTPNSQHGVGQFNNGSNCGNGAQIPFGSPSSVSSSGGGFISGTSATNRPESGPSQQVPFGNQQFYVGNGVASFNQQQSNHGAGMMNAIDNGPGGGRVIVDHPS